MASIFETIRNVVKSRFAQFSAIAISFTPGLLKAEDKSAVEKQPEAVTQVEDAKSGSATLYTFKVNYGHEVDGITASVYKDSPLNVGDTVDIQLANGEEISAKIITKLKKSAPKGAELRGTQSIITLTSGYDGINIGAEPQAIRFGNFKKQAVEQQIAEAPAAQPQPEVQAQPEVQPQPEASTPEVHDEGFASVLPELETAEEKAQPPLQAAYNTPVDEAAKRAEAAIWFGQITKKPEAKKVPGPVKPRELTPIEKAFNDSKDERSARAEAQKWMEQFSAKPEVAAKPAVKTEADLFAPLEAGTQERPLIGSIADLYPQAPEWAKPKTEKPAVAAPVAEAPKPAAPVAEAPKPAQVAEAEAQPPVITPFTKLEPPLQGAPNIDTPNSLRASVNGILGNINTAYSILGAAVVLLVALTAKLVGKQKDNKLDTTYIGDTSVGAELYEEQGQAQDARVEKLKAHVQSISPFTIDEGQSPEPVASKAEPQATNLSELKNKIEAGVIKPAPSLVTADILPPVEDLRPKVAKPVEAPKVAKIVSETKQPSALRQFFAKLNPINAIVNAFAGAAPIASSGLVSNVQKAEVTEPAKKVLSSEVEAAKAAALATEQRVAEEAAKRKTTVEGLAYAPAGTPGRDEALAAKPKPAPTLGDWAETREPARKGVNLSTAPDVLNGKTTIGANQQVGTLKSLRKPVPEPKKTDTLPPKKKAPAPSAEEPKQSDAVEPQNEVLKLGEEQKDGASTKPRRSFTPDRQSKKFVDLSGVRPKEKPAGQSVLDPENQKQRTKYTGGRTF